MLQTSMNQRNGLLALCFEHGSSKDYASLQEVPAVEGVDTTAVVSSTAP